MRVLSAVFALATTECTEETALALVAHIDDTCVFPNCTGSAEYYDCVFGKIQTSECTEDSHEQVAAWAQGARGYKQTCDSISGGNVAGLGLAVVAAAAALK
mmetsp:Transcript_8210/g.17951  ORF Transcript_8210/g.17951 Transcript_8210/m.17951 type:complete len:101 (-) Transcript_8210:275-577(-)